MDHNSNINYRRKVGPQSQKCEKADLTDSAKKINKIGQQLFKFCFPEKQTLTK